MNVWLDGYLGAVEVKLSVSEVWAVVIQPSGHWGKREKGVRRIFSDASYNLIFSIYEDEDNERRAGLLNSLRQGDREVGQQASKQARRGQVEIGLAIEEVQDPFSYCLLK